ncbi:hypothetical protein GGX14DRAFT_409871 [Mycena pura]|uniref:Uncharacterized protein n=1 Tax=Mycena pura TaxID=153505 RepID=A0AAD6YUI0_9AGAR|nr:hypothetical protein GGX14DRAFT_409871 [Mycena pura]
MDSALPDYGISRVSGYYGPGAVLGWWLLTIATTLNLVYGDVSPSRSNAPKTPSIWNLFNLDPNILAITGYPFVASLDLLANMHPYGTNPNNPALFHAPLLLIIEGKLFLCVILIALGVRSDREGEHRLVDMAFVWVILAYFAMVHYASLLACIEKLHLFAFNSLFPWVPYSWKDADDYETSELILRSLSIFIIIGLGTVYRALRVELVKDLGFWDAVLVVCCYAVFMVAVRQLYDFLMLGSGFLIAPILTHQWGGFIPQSGASFYDLDQAAAFVLGGVVPLVLSVKPMLRQAWVRYRNRGARSAETRV